MTGTTLAKKTTVDIELGRFIKTVELFSDFTDSDIEALLRNTRLKEYKKNKILFFIEDKAEHFYLIINGWVKLFRETRDGHESVLALMSKGDTFGKLSIFEDASYQYNAEITDDTQLLEVPAAFLREMAKNGGQFDHLLKKLMKARLNDLSQLGLQSEHYAIMTSAQRVGCFLLRMCKEEKEGNITLTLPYEKALVAARLGMKPETFSRSLNQLEEVGVSTKNAEVTVSNIQQLHSYVCNHCSATEGECPMATYDF